MSITRRVFLRNSALTAAGAGAIPAFLLSDHCAASNRKRMVVIFLRGAVDGLSMVVPHGEPAYYAMRPTINIPRNAVIDLDGFFGLHPSLVPFFPLWKQRQFAIIHAVGSPHPTRSHFEAQDYMESGTPGIRTTEDGWLSRALYPSAGRAIATGLSLPRILASNNRAFTVDSVAQTLDEITPLTSVRYPDGCLACALSQLARQIKSNPAVRAAFADIGGWDLHANQGSTQGQLADLLREFSQALSAFWNDLGDAREDTVIVTMSEFGRSARENRNGGTNHGHANVMFVLGGGVKGGRIYGRWPGLDQSQLHEGRDLAVTTDFRQVLGESVYKHLGHKALNQVFPGFDNQPETFSNYLG